MRQDILEKVSEDLLSVIPLVSRTIRRQVAESSITRTNPSITPLQLEIMELLDSRGAMNVSQIAERLQVPNAQLTKLIDKLVALNMVVRKPGTADRRTYDIALTNSARAAITEHEHNVTKTLRKLMSRLTEKELENLDFSLGNLHDVLLKILIDEPNSEPAFEVLDWGGMLVKIPVKPEQAESQILGVSRGYSRRKRISYT
jgi:DNA-binding MarR family transcriptional regulator